MQTVVVVVIAIVVLYVLFRVFKAVLKWLILAVCIVLAIAFFSKPDLQAHSDELGSVRKDLRKDIEKKKVTFDDYKIFSLTKKKVNGEDKIVGVGIFGKVWYFDEREGS